MASFIKMPPTKYVSCHVKRVNEQTMHTWMDSRSENKSSAAECWWQWLKILYGAITQTGAESIISKSMCTVPCVNVQKHGMLFRWSF